MSNGTKSLQLNLIFVYALSATAVRRADELLFLQEIIPHAIPASLALAKRQAKAQGDPGIIKEQGALERAFERGKIARKGKGKALGPGVGVMDPSAPPSNGSARESSFAVDPEVLARHYHPTYYGDEPAKPPSQHAPPSSRHDPDSMDTS